MIHPCNKHPDQKTEENITNIPEAPQHSLPDSTSPWNSNHYLEAIYLTSRSKFTPVVNFIICVILGQQNEIKFLEVRNNMLYIHLLSLQELLLNIHSSFIFPSRSIVIWLQLSDKGPALNAPPCLPLCISTTIEQSQRRACTFSDWCHKTALSSLHWPLTFAQSTFLFPISCLPFLTVAMSSHLLLIRLLPQHFPLGSQQVTISYISKRKFKLSAIWSIPYLQIYK